MRPSSSGTSRLLRGAATVALAVTAAAVAQQGGLMPEDVQRRFAAVKEASVANQAALRQYRWTETLQFSLKAESSTTRTFACHYDPDGKVARLPIGPPPDQSKEGPLRRRISEEAKEDAEDFMGRAWTVIGLYVPPDGQKMEQAFQADNATVDRPASGEGGLNFKNYAKPGDSMALDFDMSTRKIATLKVNSYLDDPSQPVALNVQFARLPDGTNYPATIVLNAPTKGIQVTMTNSDYQKRAQ
jgi:hypothetical protein